MVVQPVRYGPHSPFDSAEREAIEEINECVARSSHRHAAELSAAIHQQMASLEHLGEVVSQYPSPAEEQRLGDKSRGLSTLVETLSASNAANFEFFLPTRALVGRALVMAEANFYRFLRHVCLQVLEEAPGRRLAELASARLRTCMYTKLVEELLSAITCDDGVDSDVRSRSIVALAQIWEQRLTYRVSDFFPVLEATWEARGRVKAIGGTLVGTSELFQLFSAGCDSRFVDHFVRPNPSEDEREAFREFLFGKTTEELERLTRRMTDEGKGSIAFDDHDKSGERDAATAFYEFFRVRYLQAMARKLAEQPGPKRTAEAYVMIAYLRQLD